MIKSHVEEITVKDMVIDEVKCNCCGEDINLNLNDIEDVEFYKEWGYGSQIFYDGETHKFHICEKCYANWIKTFKFAPDGFGKCGMYDEDVHSQQEFEKWKLDNK